MSFKWYNHQIQIIGWLKNFTQGNWVNREDMTWVTQSNFGTHEMSKSHETYMAKYVKHFDGPMLRSLSVYLRSFKHESVSKIWSELLKRAKDLDQHDAAFKVKLRKTERSKPVEVETSINEQARLASYEK